jgi:hypothetical protein
VNRKKYSQAEQSQVLDGSNFRDVTNEGSQFQKKGQFFSAIIRFIEIKASLMDDPAASKQVLRASNPSGLAWCQCPVRIRDNNLKPFFCKAYLPIESTLNGKRPRLVH